MAGGTPIQTHLDEFNSIDMENFDIKSEDEDKDIFVGYPYAPSYKHFKEILLYSNNEICHLRMSNLTTCPKKNLIFKCILMIKLKPYL